MLFYSFYKTMVGKSISVEFKNDLVIHGKLHSVDQFLNLKLVDITVQNGEEFPHMMTLNDCFVRGSVIRYVILPKDDVDINLLEDACRNETIKLAESNK